MLKSAHLILTPLTVADLPIMLNWINNREQMLLNAPYKPVTEKQHKFWLESIQNRNDIFIFGIHLLESNRLIGSCQLRSINYIHRSTKLQIRIGEVFQQGQGYGTETIHSLLNFAFKDLNLNRVHLHVFSTNTIALHVYKKVGFIHEGLLRKAAHINGTYIDIIVMSILREEYAD